MTNVEKSCIQELVNAMEEISRGEEKLINEKKQLRPEEKRMIQRKINENQVRVTLLKNVLEIC